MNVYCVLVEHLTSITCPHSLVIQTWTFCVAIISSIGVTTEVPAALSPNVKTTKTQKYGRHLLYCNFLEVEPQLLKLFLESLQVLTSRQDFLNRDSQK